MNGADLAKIVGAIAVSSVLSAFGSLMAMKIEVAVIKNDISYIQKDISRMSK